MNKRRFMAIIMAGVITRVLAQYFIVESYDFLNNLLAITAMGLAVVVLYIVSESKNLIHKKRIENRTTPPELKRQRIMVLVNQSENQPKFFGCYRFLEEDSNH